MNRFRSKTAWLAVLVAGTLLPAVLWAQEEGITPPPAEAPPDIDALVKAVEDDVALDAKIKEEVLEQYKQARRAFATAKESRERASSLKESRESAPAKIEALKAQLAEPAPPPTIDVPADATLTQLQRLLSDAEAALKSAQDRAAAIDEERKGRNDRRAELRKTIDRLKTELEALPDKVASDDNAPPALTQARAVVLQANRAALAAQLAAAEAEVAGFDLRGDQISARRDLLSREITAGEGLVEQWRQVVAGRRKAEEQEAALRVDEARSNALDEGVVKTELDQNAATAEQRVSAKLSERIQQANADLEAVKAELDQLKHLSTNLQTKVEKAGLTQSMGQLLRRRLDDLPDLRQHRVNIGQRRREISTLEIDGVDLDSKMSDLSNIDLLVRERMREVDASTDEARRAEIAKALQGLLTERRDMVKSLYDDSNVYLNKLYDLNTAENNLISETEATRAFINERILWIRSASIPSRNDVRHAREALAWLVDPKNLAQIPPTAWQTVRDRPGLTLFFVLGLIALYGAKPHLRRTLAAMADQASRPTCQAFMPTLRATWCTLFDSAFWPGLLWLGGWLLGSRLDCPVYCKDISAAMDEIAYTWLFIAFLRRCCADTGLGIAHFKWDAEGSTAFRVWLGWLVVWILPAAFASTTFMNMHNEAWHSSLGRLFTIITYVLVAGSLFRLLSTDSRIMQRARALSPPGWPWRRRNLLMILGVVLPVALSGASLYGYHYTVDRLGLELLWSTMIVAALILLRDLALRWLLISRRRIAIAEYRKRRAAELGSDKTADQPKEDPETTALRLATINEQSKRLVRSGIVAVGAICLYWTWSDLFPALNLLDQVVLWTTEAPVLQDGVLGEPVNVTLADLGAMLLLVVITAVAARNLPGLLEITALMRLPLKHGERYAISTVTRYILIIVGGVAAFRQIGIGWANVQWMAAAITFGLGFGLQEIFANFVSGLILLFERPIRVGDTVTVGQDEGTVTDIQMRSTTVLNWSRKEVIIPNREFVTGRIINWSLKDPVLRVVVPVGVAYGTDPERVRYELLKCAREQPGVLSDPEPQALFLQFGDSALNFELRAFISCDETSALMTKHDLHMKVSRAFEEAGIEIAFPQRDLHIRSLPDGRLLGQPQEQAPGEPVQAPSDPA